MAESIGSFGAGSVFLGSCSNNYTPRVKELAIPGGPGLDSPTMLRTVTATRYVTPLREGGSLPAVVEADDDGLYVVKFSGAGQGPKALIAELVAGEIGRHLGLLVPEIVFVDLDPRLGAAEPDQEIQDLLERSGGLNLGLDFLPGALSFDPAVGPFPDPDLAADIVWFDALVTNVDRTAKNVNMLVWHRTIVADRPRRGPLRPAHVARSGGPRAAILRAGPRSCPAAVRGLHPGCRRPPRPSPDP